MEWTEEKIKGLTPEKAETLSDKELLELILCGMKIRDNHPLGVIDILGKESAIPGHEMYNFACKVRMVALSDILDFVEEYETTELPDFDCECTKCKYKTIDSETEYAENLSIKWDGSMKNTCQKYLIKPYDVFMKGKHCEHFEES